MTIRELIRALLANCGDIDDEVGIVLLKREAEGNTVEFGAIFPVARIDSHDNLCVEVDEIKWVNYGELEVLRHYGPNKFNK